MPQLLLDTITVVCSFTMYCTCRTKIGVLVLDGGNLVLENQMDLVGDLECSDGNCPTKTKESFYDFEKLQMCPASDGPPPTGDTGDVCAASVRACWQIYSL